MKNVFSVLFSPTETFTRLREKGGWVWGFVAILVVSLIVAWLDMPLIELAAREAYEKAGMENIDKMMKFARASSYVGVLFGAAFTVFFGAVLLLLLNLIVRGEAKYMQLVKVTTLAYVPAVISSVISGILARVTDAQSMQDIAISAGVFFTEKTGFVYHLANILNPFAIWGLVLMVIGSAVMMKRSVSTVAWWIVIVWVAFQLVGASLGSMFSA